MSWRKFEKLILKSGFTYDKMSWVSYCICSLHKWKKPIWGHEQNVDSDTCITMSSFLHPSDFSGRERICKQFFKNEFYIQWEEICKFWNKSVMHWVQKQYVPQQEGIGERRKLSGMSVNKIPFILCTDKCGNSIFSTFRYLLIECEDQEPAVKQDSKVREMYLTVMKTFSQVGHIFINK